MNHSVQKFDQYVGIDVSKAKLDFFPPYGNVSTLPNDVESITKFLRYYKDQKKRKVCIVCEATGIYHLDLVDVAYTLGVPLAVVDPRRVFHSKLSDGNNVKTDKRDAEAIANFATEKGIQPTEYYPLSIKLKEFIRSREALVKMRKGSKNILETLRLYSEVDCHNKLLKITKAAEKNVVKRMQEEVAKHPWWQGLCDTLQTCEGVGPITSLYILAYFPGIGTYGRRSAAKHVGVAPINHESGTKTGERHISGGVKVLRNMLYECAVTAERYNPVIKELNERLKQEKKSVREIRIQEAHKLLTYLEALARRYRQEHPYHR